MARAELHEFKRDLQNKPGPGSNAPPRTIRARDLDGNFKKVTVIEPTDQDPPTYTVEYKKDGTVLNILPTFPTDNALYVLGVEGQTLRWVKTEDC